MSVERPADDAAGARLHVVLVEPEIAANTGAIGRSCVAIGAMLWLVRPLGFHLDDRHRRRAGLDYWEHLTWRGAGPSRRGVRKRGRASPRAFPPQAAPLCARASYTP